MRAHDITVNPPMKCKWFNVSNGSASIALNRIATSMLDSKIISRLRFHSLLTYVY